MVGKTANLPSLPTAPYFLANGPYSKLPGLLFLTPLVALPPPT